MEQLSLPGLQVGSSLVSEVRRGRPMAQTVNQEVVTLRTDCQVVFLAPILWKLSLFQHNNLRDTFTSAHHHNSILMRPQVLREQTHWPSHWCRASTAMTPGSWTASSTERTSRWSTTLSRGYLSGPSSSALVTNWNWKVFKSKSTFKNLHFKHWKIW